MFIPHISQYRFDGQKFVLKANRFKVFLSTLLLLAATAISLQACSTFESPVALDATVLVPSIEEVPKSQEATTVKPQNDQPSMFAVKASSYMKRVNKNLSDADAFIYVGHIQEASEEYGVDKRLLLALIRVESRFNRVAVSPDGAKGLTQVIPAYHTSKIQSAQSRFKGSLFHPGVSIFVGASVLRECIDSSKSLTNALLRYNGSLSDPTKRYAKAVLQEYEVVIRET